jgi:hypothetical protein
LCFKTPKGVIFFNLIFQLCPEHFRTCHGYFRPGKGYKNNSSNFVNEHNFIKGKFSWQEGYGAFSYSQSHIGSVYDYILNQEKHHIKMTFKQEYLDFLKKFEVEYDEKYLFDWYD